MSKRLVVETFDPVDKTTTPLKSTGNLIVVPNINEANIAIPVDVNTKIQYYLIPQSYGVQFTSSCDSNMFYNLPPLEFVQHNNFIIEVNDFSKIFGYICGLFTITFNLVLSSATNNFILEMNLVSTYNSNDDPEVVAHIYKQQYDLTAQRQTITLLFPYYDSKVKCFQLLSQEVLIILPFPPATIADILNSGQAVQNVALFYNLTPVKNLVPFIQTLTTKFSQGIQNNYSNFGNPFTGYVDLLFSPTIVNQSNPLRTSIQVAIGMIQNT
jgi:hypothetical protein